MSVFIDLSKLVTIMGIHLVLVFCCPFAFSLPLLILIQFLSL
jgi:hypothetical protein